MFDPTAMRAHALHIRADCAAIVKMLKNCPKTDKNVEIIGKIAKNTDVLLRVYFEVEAKGAWMAHGEVPLDGGD